MSKQRKRTRFSWLSLLATCLLISVYLSACGGDGTTPGSNPLANNPTQPPTATTTPAKAPKQQQITLKPDDILKYWTPDKMTSAINVDILSVDAKQFAQQAVNSLTGKNSAFNGQNPLDKLPDIPPMQPQDLNELLQQFGQLASTDTQTSASMLGALRPQATYSFPLSTVGKVFFSSGGKNYVCSGSSVASDNRSVVDTAGHCIFNNGNWVSNWVFCPMYYNGKAPYGCWAANYFYTTEEWADSGSFAYDYGLVAVSPNRYGKLNSKVGGAGWIYDANGSQNFHAYGYPAQKPFNGQTMKSCQGDGTLWKDDGSYAISIPCGMNGGSSGGPWFIKRNGGWYVNGHNDFTSRSHPGLMYSTYYGDTWYDLYSRANRVSV